MTRYNILQTLLIFSFVGLVSCNLIPTDSNIETNPVEELVNKVRGSDRLYTTEYVVRKIVTYDDIVKVKGTVFNRQFDFKMPLGDRKVIIPMEAIVKGYIDFSQFGPDNVIVNPEENTIRIILPNPKVEVTSTKIDHKGVKEFVNGGRSLFSEAELEQFQKQGRAAIINSLSDLGIVETARLHAYNTLLPIITQMGYTPDQVTIDFSNDFDKSDLAPIISIYKD